MAKVTANSRHEPGIAKLASLIKGHVMTTPLLVLLALCLLGIAIVIYSSRHE